MVEPSLPEPEAPPFGVWPVVPLAPDGELPEAVLPPEAEPPSRLHPERSAPLSANAIAAANAVNFILTSMGLWCLTGSN